MIYYLPIILVCHLNSPKCDEETAINKVIGDYQNNLMTCIRESYESVAKLAYMPKMDEPFYVRVKCKVVK